MNAIPLALVISLIGLTSCYRTPWSFEDERVVAYCEWQVACTEGVYQDVEDCWATPPENGDMECVGYDSTAAHDCIDQMEELTCEDSELPAVCDDVYESCEEYTY